MTVTDKDKWEAEAIINMYQQFGFIYAVEEVARIRSQAVIEYLEGEGHDKRS